jgi:nucleotide-binding universal stress UspA family protein
MDCYTDGAHHRSGRALRKRLKEDLMGAIVCGVDDSESAKEAARVARVLCAKLGHRLVFVRVVETADPCQKISVLAKRLQHLAKEETEVDCSAGWLVDVGYPVDRLVAAAAEEKASFIVVGSNGPCSSLLGSISAAMSRRAPCPIVVVPSGADELRTDGHPQREVAAHTAGLGRTVPETGERYKTNDRDTRDFAGGIVRFSLGSHNTNQS